MRHVLAVVLCKSNNCRPEAAESRAQASDAQRRACPEPAEGISALIRQHTERIRADRDKKGDPGAPFLAFFARSGTQCDKHDYRGILAGLEGVSGKKAVDSETMTVKN